MTWPVAEKFVHLQLGNDAAVQDPGNTNNATGQAENRTRKSNRTRVHRGKDPGPSRDHHYDWEDFIAAATGLADADAIMARHLENCQNCHVQVENAKAIAEEIQLKVGSLEDE